MHQEPATAPTCPLCASNERVERERLRSTSKAHSDGPLRWVCGGCWTVFTGGQAEWDAWRERRDRWRARHQTDNDRQEDRGSHP